MLNSGGAWGNGLAKYLNYIARKMRIILRHYELRHTNGVYAGKVDFKCVVLRHYVSRHFRVLRVLKNPFKLPKSPKCRILRLKPCSGDEPVNYPTHYDVV